MFKRIRIGLLFLILFSPTVIGVTAQSNHSLIWGVSVGDEFTYYMEKKTIDPFVQGYLENMSVPFIDDVEVGQKIIARVTQLESIPDQINTTSSRYIPQANCTLIRANDSHVLIENMSMLMMPVRDWDLLTEMNNYTGMDGWTVIDNLGEWGSKFEQSFVFAIFFVDIYLEMVFEKQNGSLSRLQIRVTVTGTEMVDLIFVKWHPDLTPKYSFNFWPIVIGSIISLVVIIWYIRRRKKHSQQDIVETLTNQDA
ncbi:MAG: hypothetical protein GF411_09135 [Candidatus Lokiarchaeota archaeon]|nr:hypothetical protein [Candidatus Lokiarchaeota archaeon]